MMTVLIAPNGIPVELKFREYILTHNWSHGNQPLGKRYQANPVQIHRPDLEGGERQLFVFSVLWWSPLSDLGVVNEMYMGLELDAAYKERGANGKTITLDSKEYEHIVNCMGRLLSYLPDSPSPDKDEREEESIIRAAYVGARALLDPDDL